MVVSAVLLVLLTIVLAAGQEIEISTTTGTVRGVASQNANVGSRKWLGIPFAKPPVGELRWASPQKADSWTNILEANRSVGCPQSCGLPFPSCPVVEDEDCLHLNIYSPYESTSTSNLTVMIWFHGGAFTAGFAATELYDGAYYATKQNVVIVTVNYRIGALGWLASSEFHGNYGFEDQQLAMEWVKDNIVGFGGNPQSVTLWGQSAGGGTIAVHLSNSRSDPLFHRAIVESNPFSIPYRNQDTAPELTNLFLNEVGCAETDLACLRNKSSAEILIAQQASVSRLQISLTSSGAANFLINAFLPWTPNVGNTTGKVKNPTEAWLSGQIQDKPIIVGTTKHEGIIYLYGAIRGLLGSGVPMPSVLYTGMLYAIFGLDKSISVSNKYPTSTDNRLAASQVATEYVFACPSRRVVYNIAKDCDRKSPIYLYEVDHPMSFSEAVWTSDPECHGKTCHGGDLVFTWAQIYNNNPLVEFSAEEIKLSADISAAFGSFAKGQQPILSSGTVWTTFDKNNQVTLVFTGNSSQNKENYTATTHSCDFWDALQEYNSAGNLTDTTECTTTPSFGNSGGSSVLVCLFITPLMIALML